MKKLNLGCGKDIRSGYVNVDIQQLEGVDETFDFNFFPYPYPDNEFDYIFAANVLEHLDNIPKIMKELHRIAKSGGELQIIVPYYNCYGAYSDVTHKRYFSHLSFESFYKKDPRGIYSIEERFKLKKLKLVPTRLGKLFLFDFVRLPLSFFFGQIIQTIDIRLIIVK